MKPHLPAVSPLLIPLVFFCVTVVGCGGNTPAPVTPKSVSKQVVETLTDRFGDRSFAVEATKFDKEKDQYTVDLRYKVVSGEMRHSVVLARNADEKLPRVTHSGQIPIEDFGEENPHGRTFFQIQIVRPEG